jgi:basic amino acid/polyamine antiporter, APA family
LIKENLFRRKSIPHILKDAEKADSGIFKLKKSLNLVDLTALAIAAIIGAGAYSTIGNACATGGAAVSLMFIFTAIACAFSALCYAAFASAIPISGSAYTYAYASLGELIAWIIGWDLLMEYSVGNIAVAISWSDYFTNFLTGIGLHFPEFLSVDYHSAHKGFLSVTQSLAAGGNLETLPGYLKEAYLAWINAPILGGIKIIADVPAFAIVVVITIIVYTGIRESKTTGNLLVVIKMLVILLVISVGAFYVKPSNWTPFAPNGLKGVLSGVSAVFFAFIGFDAISSTAEECKNPQRDLPKAMILSLIICTILYVLIALVLTGMVHHNELFVGDPLAYVFKRVGLNWISGIISLGAIIAMAGVLLVFQIGQPRIWMSMSRDGLLPKRFAAIHPKFKTPSFSTIITGIVVAVPSLFMNITEMTDLTSIGTLFAFVLVCAGIMHLDSIGKPVNGKFKIPFVNSSIIFPVVYLLVLLILFLFKKNDFIQFFNFGDVPVHQSFWDVFKHKIPLLSLIIISGILAIRTIKHKYSLIPLLGFLFNLYLMTELGLTNWLRFLLWLVVGLVIYFTYSAKNSKLKNKDDENEII